MIFSLFYASLGAVPLYLERTHCVLLFISDIRLCTCGLLMEELSSPASRDPFLDGERNGHLQQNKFCQSFSNLPLKQLRYFNKESAVALKVFPVDKRIHLQRGWIIFLSHYLTKTKLFFFSSGISAMLEINPQNPFYVSNNQLIFRFSDTSTALLFHQR